VDLNNPSILKQDDNDKRLNIIDLIGKYSQGDRFISILCNLLPKYIKNCSFLEPDKLKFNPRFRKFIPIKREQELNITKKEYYDKYILEDINMFNICQKVVLVLIF
jgi:hypothetical protein